MHAKAQEQGKNQTYTNKIILHTIYATYEPMKMMNPNSKRIWRWAEDSTLRNLHGLVWENLGNRNVWAVFFVWILRGPYSIWTSTIFIPPANNKQNSIPLVGNCFYIMHHTYSYRNKRQAPMVIFYFIYIKKSPM